ncbi:DUF4349 domain-containing protein [Microbacterium suwonense]|uniref:DUF4349 domain-containing protein n=1 Tax=Microbacterium suwonense TaxID=683047 RepID=A0ABM8FS09_9MICO|nr:DUF4349 domain-containing protein [Microbacterium suwonense]BDZ38476.1 hypothetical protein GCM10025863_10900 [Microbacterium suwonense]
MSEDSSISLPPLSDESIARIEQEVFDDIAEERPPSPATPAPAVSRPRRRRWAVGLGIAAAFVGGAVIAPPLLSGITSSSMTMSDVGSARDSSAEWADAVVPAVGVPDSVGLTSDGRVTTTTGGAETPDRDIITTGQIILRVADVSAAVDTLTALAEEHDGYIESSDVGLDSGDPVEGTAGSTRSQGSGWLSIRIPSADLSAVTKAIGDAGQVLHSSISHEDVTSTAVDLRARVAAAEASVQRLTELMTKSGSVSDLITAESALNERQAQLESYQQELKNLDQRVAMSTVRVQLTKQASVSQADPAGFGDGLLAGWNGLIIALNALVVTVGFLLPWLAIAGIVLLAVWLIRRRVRKTRVP